ncbi:FAD binding domain protein [Fusarium beomiforme]|uniref:FAD binding domain protein n=1 Tax=Fusarium beomiforme TaxID=44412 RepID=A0A9P5AAV4_9HYPO|nr:FAD binding domain protein [Fusarium beomiforme]
MPATDFKVIIAGGGIAGLALANMLEQFDLDYILLEAHSDIAPPVGASIGMFPNGLRILDQLGCCQPIKDIYGGEIPYDVTITSNERGEIINRLDGIFEHLERRHGYGLFFFDRQKLLEILYDHIRHNDRIHLNKKVTDVKLIDKGVEVTCSDNTTFSGTILVGADGIHSTVRPLMHQLAHSLEPGYFDINEEDKVPCYYACSFGIAQHVPGWSAGQQHMVTGRGRSQLVVSGPDDRVYWFLFEKLPAAKYGKDIPRYTKKDEEGFVRRHGNVAITPNVTFGQVFAKRVSSSLTPLHEVVYKKWFFKRITTLGDSAHKPNPIGGQGGNGALESCAELINALLRMKDTREEGLSNPSDGDIHQIFSDVQSARYDRAQTISRVRSSSSGESTLNALGAPSPGGARIEQLPVPYRPRAIPFHDERPAKPILGKLPIFVRCGFVCAMALPLLATTKTLRIPFEELSARSGSSNILNLLVTVFEVPMYDKDLSSRIRMSNFLPQLISPLLIYAIEGHRLGNQATPLAMPLMFTAAMQVQGLARVACFHSILISLFGFENPPSRAVPLRVAQSLVPAITIGFLIPTIIMLAPTPDVQGWRKWALLWQVTPPLFNVLLTGIATGLRKWKGEEKQENIKDRYEAKDLNALQSVYTFAFAVQATAHITSLAYGWGNPDVSLFDTFLSLPNMFETDWSLPSLGAKLAALCRYDLVFATVGYLGSQLYSIWDLRRVGFVRTDEAVKAGLLTLAGQWIVGPGATWAGLWYWRETKIASVCV